MKVISITFAMFYWLVASHSREEDYTRSEYQEVGVNLGAILEVGCHTVTVQIAQDSPTYPKKLAVQPSLV